MKALFDDKITDKLCHLIESGIDKKTAADSCGIGRSTFYDWLRRGKEGEEPYRAFLERIRTAEGEAKGRMIQTIYQKAGTDWRAGAHWLSKMDPARWGDKVEVITNEIDGLMKTLKANLSPEEYRNAVRALYENGGS